MAKMLDALFGVLGRTGIYKPYTCPPNQVIDAVNVDWWKSSLGRKRRGATAYTMPGGGGGGIAMSQFVRALWTWTPPSYLGLVRELWAMDEVGGFRRRGNGVGWSTPTLRDAVAGAHIPSHTNTVEMNGKLFIAYQSIQNRIYVWDYAASIVRRVGLAAPAAPAVANQGAGAYAATIRYYKVVYRHIDGSDTLRQSEPSPAISITPSGAGASIRITKPAAINEGETHWVIYGSPDNSNFMEITELAIATTTYDDSAAPLSYSGDSIAVAGTFALPPACRYLIADDSRIILGNPYRQGLDPAHPGRIYWTSRLGSTDLGDDERVSNTSTIKSYLDVEEEITGMSAPIQGSFYVFSDRSRWKITQTGNIDAPYTKFRIAGGVGCISHKSIIVAEDEVGDPAVYWLSKQGPYRAGNFGQQTMVDDIQDIWDQLSLGSNQLPHGVYHKDIGQIWWWIPAEGTTSAYIQTKIVFDIKLGRVNGDRVRGGWSVHTGPSAAAFCSTIYDHSGVGSIALVDKPFIGQGRDDTSVTPAIWTCDTGSDDAGTAFAGYLKSRPYQSWGMGSTGVIVEDAVLVAEALTGATIQLGILKDFEIAPHNVTCVLTPASTETRVFRTFPDSRVADANSVQYIIGDVSANTNQWSLDALVIPTKDAGTR